MRLPARDREKLRGLMTGACGACEGVFYTGMAGIFAYLQLPSGAVHGWDTSGGYHEIGDIEVYSDYLGGCPKCHADIKRVPLEFSDLHEDGELVEWPERVTEL